MFPSYNYSKILFFEVPYHRQSHRDGMSKKGWRKPAFCMKRPCRRGRSGKWMKIPDRTSLNIWGKHIPMVLWWLLAVNSLPVFLRNHESQLKLKSKRYIVRRSDRCHLDLFICGFVQENYQQNNDVLKFYGNMWYTLYIHIYSIWSIYILYILCIYIYTLYIYYVYYIYMYTIYIYTLYIKYIHKIYTISIYYIYILYLYTISIYYIYILYLYTISINYIYKLYLYILYLYTISIYYIYILYLYTISIYCIYILYLYTIYILYIYILCIYYIYILCIYIYVICIINPGIWGLPDLAATPCLESHLSVMDQHTILRSWRRCNVRHFRGVP